MEEIWKSLDFVGFPNCSVSNLGNIRSARGYKMKLHPNHGGYLQCTLSYNMKKQHFKVHRLVAQAFIPNPEGLPQINHKDLNKQNNHITNLEWCTASENQLHRYENRRP